MQNDCNTSVKRKLYFLVALSCLTSCQIFFPETATQPEFVTRVITQPFDKIWVATQKALKKYPVKKLSFEEKLILTKKIPLNTTWAHPNLQDNIKSSGEKYFIKISFVSSTKKNTRIIIQKNITKKASFFAPDIQVKSDLVEEQTILYEILRNLKLSNN